MTTSAADSPNAPGLNKNTPPIVSRRGQVGRASGNVAALESLTAEVRALGARLDQINSFFENRIQTILTPDELAERLKIGIATVWRYKKAGMPALEPPIESPGLVRFEIGEVLAWLRVNKPRRKPR